MIVIPPFAEPHYRTRLILKVPRGEAGPAVTALARGIREALRTWTCDRFPHGGDPLESDAFHGGRTRLISLQPPGQVRTTQWEQGGEGGAPTETGWAFQAQLPDADVRSRRWAHEVAMAPAGDGALRLSLRVHHWLEVGEVGWRAPRPRPGPPRWLPPELRSAEVELTDGYEPIPLSPVPVRPGDGRRFVELLADPERRVAVVYLSATRPSGRPAIDAVRVASAVALMAVVHVAESPDLDDELDHFLSPDLRCYGGALRIYRPGLKPNARGAAEAERHRYVPRGTLTSRPIGDLLAEISGEVVRAVVSGDPDHEPVTFGEIEAMRSRRELATLRKESDALRHRSRGGLSAEDAESLFRLNHRLEERLRAVEEDNARLARRAFHAVERLEERDDEPSAESPPPRGALDHRALIGALRELPTAPANALELAAHVFPHRLLVTDRARRTAEEASCDDAAMAWRMLVAMADVLHPLHFDAEAAGRSALEIRDEFQNRTRFDVAFTESKSTKASDRLRSLRTLEYDGDDVELLWHVKWGSRPPKLLRVYYHPDAERRLLVIGWFGDHLETAGTARM
jgi:hypothetical protein